MAYTNPSISDFQAYFSRDFPYGTDPDTSVLTTDISKAFSMVNININQGLFADQASYNIGYLLLSAHFLVLNLRASSQGLKGQFAFLEQSKGVGSVNVAYNIPQMVQDNPYWSMLMKTNYGAQFMQLILPQLIGRVMTVPGSTRP